MVIYKIIDKINTFFRRVEVEKGEFQAVHGDDLITLLKSLGEYNDVIEGKKKCFFCDEKITLENLSIVFPYNNNIEYCCSEDICYKKLMNLEKNV